MSQIIYVGKHLLTYCVPRHIHDNWEFIYCTGGEGQVRFDNFTLKYRSSDIVIIPPYTAHQNDSEHGFTNIHMNVQTSLMPSIDPCIVHDDSNRFIYDAFSASFSYFSRNLSTKNPLMSAYGDLIIYQLLDSINSPKLSPVVRDIMNTIISNYPDEKFQLDSYLQSLPFNYDYLRKLFKKEMGMTPHNFLVNTRLQASAERLSSAGHRTINISHIAHMCGFHEPLYFSRQFRKKYGLSPSDYQAIHKNDNSERRNSNTVKKLI